MEILKVEHVNSVMMNDLIKVWRASVEATHLFLSKEEMDAIQNYVPQGIDSMENFYIVLNDNEICGFMGLDKQVLEMIFIHPSQRKKGIGKKLLEIAINRHHVNQVMVNEDNPSARGFYESIGFKVYKRSDLDEQGNPYPILYMSLEDKKK